MNPERWHRICELFELVRATPASQRAALLASETTGDQPLRLEVERLLADDQRLDSNFMNSQLPLALRETALGRTLAVGSEFDGYTIVREIAVGGMGRVYEARQLDPARVVALKTLTSGAASAARTRRFRQEADILGRLRHPSIAQIYATGVVNDLPYFAMEFVEGARDILTDAAVRGLALRARLQLFVNVCEAIQHGHQKGVVHRDLKPSNILVDAAGQPKVIDFGIARIMAADGAPRAAHTGSGDLLGTLLYMSPEQVTDPSEVDTRSDVYSLGVVLHELTTGRAPFSLGDNLAASLQRVRTFEPRRPPELSQDLGWILLKALAKERDTRYQSAEELANDLRRFLAGDAVAARAPTAGYRLRKLLRRYRFTVGAAAAVLLALAIGLLQARAEAAEARRQADRAATINRVLRRVLTAVDPLDRGPEVRVVQLLQDAELELDRGETTAKAAADLHAVFCECYLALRMFPDAKRHLDAARAFADSSNTADSRFRIQVLALRSRHAFLTGEHRDAEAIGREAESLARRELAIDDEVMLRLQGSLAELLQATDQFAEAEQRYDALVDNMTARWGSHHRETIGVLGGRALVWLHRGRHDDAIAEFERIVTLCDQFLPPGHLRAINARFNLAIGLATSGQPSKAEPGFRDVLQQMSDRFGDRHALVHYASMALGTCLTEQGRQHEAIEPFEQSYRAAQRTWGAENPMVERAREGLAQAYRAVGREDDARRLAKPQ